MRGLYQLYKFFFLQVSTLGCILNLPILSAFSIIFSLSKLKFIKLNNSNKNNSKIIIFYRSGGFQDLKEAYKNQSSNHSFYILDRTHLKNIYKYFFLKKYNNNLKLYLKNKSILILDKNYFEYTYKVVSWLKFFLKKISFLSFSLFYWDDVVFRENAKKLGISNYLLYKECFRSPIEQNIYFENRFYKYLNSFKSIGVYNLDTKKYLLNNSKVKPSVIKNIGCSRSSPLYKKIAKGKVNKEKIKNILLFYIEDFKGVPKVAKNRDIKFRKKIQINKNTNWRKLSQKVSKIIIRSAKKHPNVNFIVKCKIGQKIPKSILNQFNIIQNIKVIKHGLGHKFIEVSQIILGLNSAATIEALLAKKLLMVPFFINLKDRLKDYLYNYPVANIFFNEKKFEENLNNKISKGYIIKYPYNQKQKMVIEKYLGDYNNSKKNLRNFFS
tara:strand:+ start:288 stop:1604 length:1317 start_codon:yes stop_codon:yes gene_type:complete